MSELASNQARKAAIESRTLPRNERWMKGVNEGKAGRKKKRKETKEGKVKEENQS